MLDFGATELFIIAVLAIIVVGPKELPKLIRSVMGMVRKVREMGSEFQAGVKKMADEVELDAVTRKLNEAGNIDLDAKKPPKKASAEPAAEFSDYKEFDYDEYDYDGGGYGSPPIVKEKASDEDGREDDAEPSEETVATTEEPLVQTPSIGNDPEQLVEKTEETSPEKPKKTKKTKKIKSSDDD